MGLDVGMKTIGIAVSDELGIAANPVETLTRQGTGDDAAAVVARAVEHGVATVVIGMPLDLDGTEGHRARRVRVLIDAISERLPPDIEVAEWDERFSTVAVERVLVDADLSRRRRKQVVDKQAAAYILQGWLDAQRPAE